MVLTDAERKERKRESDRKYREKNRDKLLEKKKKYREENKEELKEYKREYNKTPAGKKANTIRYWKHRGLIHDNYSELYDKYIGTTCCEVCKKVFPDSYDRCMDHDHDTGLFRQVLCRGCNSFDYWKTK